MLAGVRRMLLLGSWAAAVAGCAVEARPPPPRCPGGMWVSGHYGPRGRWHPGHWRCPGAVEVIEID
jgi:hypothetical protein